MRRSTIITTAVAVTVATVGIGSVVAARIVDDDDRPITGEELRRATAVALEHLGEGRVTDTEVGDEDSYYEVEVTIDDGRQVDVQLDEDFNVVDTMADDDGPADDD